jgi:hypothetical protein
VELCRGEDTEAVLRILFARRSSATSRRSSVISLESAVVTPGWTGVDPLALAPVAQRGRADVQHRAHGAAGGQLRLAPTADALLVHPHGPGAGLLVVLAGCPHSTYLRGAPTPHASPWPHSHCPQKPLVCRRDR